MILQNITNIWQRINDAEQKFDRTSGSVDLLVVSKGRTVIEVKSALKAGAHRFGENYVQEAVTKITALKDEEIEWHFIGKIQSNKTQLIADNFSWVHTISDLHTAGRLSMQRSPELPPLNVCLQVNISEEPTKSGATIDALSDLAGEVEHLPNIRLRGLMAIPAVSHDLDEQRAIFHQVSQLYQKMVREGVHLDTLSMGMTGDFEAAIAEGSTMVRLGTAIFGPRPPKN